MRRRCGCQPGPHLILRKQLVLAPTRQSTANRLELCASYGAGVLSHGCHCRLRTIYTAVVCAETSGPVSPGVGLPHAGHASVCGMGFFADARLRSTSLPDRPSPRVLVSMAAILLHMFVPSAADGESIDV